MIARRLFVILFLLIVTLTIPAALHAANTTLITAGSVWKYLDSGSNQGTAWSASGFNDSTWAAGPAQLGYGDGDEATVVSFGPNSSAKYITTYFRKTFSIANPSVFTTLTLNMIRDDGAVVYVNGVEVWRSNMPTGTIAYTTAASSAVSDDGGTWQTTAISPSVLVAGTNTIAVEIHQSSGTSSDISFDFSMIASDAVSVTRGPYLQMGTHNSMIVRWRTNVATDSQVRFGTAQGLLTGTATDGTVTTEHIVNVTGLAADAKYFYQVGTTAAGLAGNDASTYFYTNPMPGTVRPYRFWVIGDAGTGNAQQTNVLNAYDTFNGAGRTDAWLMLGDNAYNSGTDAEYQSYVYNIYPSTLKNVVLWPALGNHDTAQSTNPPANLPYFEMFSLPTNAEAGGFSSGTEKYYSFDYGNVHFIELDAMASSRSSTGAMANWLQSDLAQNTKQWTVAYWHHAPYTFGTHNSDTEIELKEMRENINPILEAANVDLVLAGHSHSYERSYLIDGHYGTSSTFTSGMKVDATGGPYSKAGVNSHEGTVYIVAGTSGRVGSLLAQAPYPAMFSSRTEAGSLVLDVNGDQMLVKFLTETGSVLDTVTINKGVAVTPPNAPSGLTATAVSTSQINLTWSDNSTNEDGFKIERSTDGVNFTQIATAAANATSYSNTGLAAGTLYYYRVFTYNTAGNSASPSNTAYATTLALPNAPSGLTATAVSTSQIDLTWVDNSNNEDGFKIERSTDGVNFTQIATAAANATSYSNTGLTTSTQYHYRVFAYNAAGNSASPSNTANATTLAPPAPNAPSGLSATAVSTSQINLTWVDNSSDEDGFKIERSTDGVNFTQIATAVANATSYSNTGLTASTQYYYRVFAYNTAGNSASPSNTANATTLAPPAPSAPSGLSATAVSTSQINLTWVDSSSDEDGFKIERSTDGVNFSQIATAAVNATSYSSTSLTAGTLYYYRVFSYNVGGNSASPSNTASATTLAPPSAPSGLSATAVSTSQINLTWVDNSSDEDGFKIERSTDGVNFSQIATAAANATSYSNTGLTISTLYYYRVFAYNASGNSVSPSNTASATTLGPTTVISAGSTWKYLDDGSNQGTAWRGVNFNDVSWSSGAAQLGYGDGDEQTVVSFGSNSKKKYITTYFRQSITVTNPSQFTTLNLSLIRDDGAIVYVNGVEVWRSNMPTGMINFKTTASSAIEGAAESTWNTLTLPPSVLVSGNNVIAVEIHQDSATNTDISFDLKLIAQ